MTIWLEIASIVRTIRLSALIGKCASDGKDDVMYSFNSIHVPMLRVSEHFGHDHQENRAGSQLAASIGLGLAAMPFSQARITPEM